MSSFTQNLQRQYHRLRLFVQRDIWEFSRLQDRSFKGHCIALARILAITVDGVVENRLFSRAAALSYSSLIAFGPVLAIVILVSGAFMRGNPEEQIKQALLFIAPSLGDFISLDSKTSQEASAGANKAKMESLDTKKTDDEPVTDKNAPAEASTDLNTFEKEELSNALDALIHQITVGAQSAMGQIEQSGRGLASTVGVFVLILIGIQLLTSVETTLNQIWGVREGRSWGQRIVFYWTFISLGTLLGLGGLSLISVSTIASAFDLLPFGRELTPLIVLFSPLLSFSMLVLLLTLFYRFFPNTSVRAAPALSGALVVAILLVANNLLSILYIKEVIRFQSLYGSVGIIPVLMLGLYFFWIFVLLGGQLTFAVQNANFLTNQQAWNTISRRARETLSLATLLVICRRFHACAPPYGATELGDILRVPGNVLNQSLSRLQSMGLINSLPQEDEDGLTRQKFQPSRPLSKIYLAQFSSDYALFGNSEAEQLLKDLDPLLPVYRKAVDEISDERLHNKSLEQLFETFPLDQKSPLPA